MRAVLQAIAEELQRLKSDGESTVAVSDETLAGLRAMVKARRGERAAPLVPAATVQAAARGAVHASGTEGGATMPVNPLRAERAASVLAAGAPVVPAGAGPLRGLVAAKAGGGELPAPPKVVLPEGDKAARWAALRAFIAADAGCVAQLGPGGKLVFGVGSLDAKIVFVADAPSEEEERAGSPLAGASGELLAKMIGAMGLKPEAVFVTTLLPWRPQALAAEGGAVLGDRPPTAAELVYGEAFFRALVEIVRPQVVVALGQEAAQGLRQEKIKTLAEVRGRWMEYAGAALLVTCKPSYLLRSGTNRTKRPAWEELMKVMERVGLPISEKQRGYFL
ncbi:MAG: hypothetical protein RL376_1668 [Verrucomicrobiota bacterium]|jgi:DNA polymerase